MTREEKQNRIDTLRKLLTEAENISTDDGGAASCAPPHPKWKPAHGARYFYIEKDGNISSYEWDNDSVDQQMLKGENVYESEKAARFALERRKVLAEMNEWAGKNYDGAYIYYYRPFDKIMIDWDGDSNCCNGDIRFKSVDDAQNCIKEVGEDRIKKYYFCLPKDDEYEAESGV